MSEREDVWLSRAMENRCLFANDRLIGHLHSYAWPTAFSNKSIMMT